MKLIIKSDDIEPVMHIYLEKTYLNNVMVTARREDLNISQNLCILKIVEGRPIMEKLDLDKRIADNMGIVIAEGSLVIASSL